MAALAAEEDESPTSLALTGAISVHSAMRLLGKGQGLMVQQQQKQQREKLPTGKHYGTSDFPFSV